MNIIVLIILAITVEALVEYGKSIFKKSLNWTQFIAAVLAIGLALAAGVDLFEIVGVSFKVPFVGVVLTGIIFSRGANYLSDFMKRIQSLGGTADVAGSD